ncbi:MAG: anaphase promoting complex subunit 5 [Cirrosporium novae-zelandiae]|nr:MAG: anaphase promoting complex subunit 5 [Cirrosporium novae-zelandiae]
MARYLTPSKVGLLVLISVYADGAVPTISSISILSFIVAHILPQDPSKTDGASLASARDFQIPVDDFELTLSPHISTIPGRTIWDLFLKKIWAIDCCESLHCFFTHLSYILARTHEQQQIDVENGIQYPPDRMRLSRTSPFGIFIRKAQLEFTRLQFHDVVFLWECLIAYRAPTLAHWRTVNPSAGPLSFDINLQQNTFAWGNPLNTLVYGHLGENGNLYGFFSTHDVEKLLEFQVDEMQNLGSRVPDEIKAKLREISRTNIAVPSLFHYIKFLDSWKASDYPSAFSNLHRYFDYTMQSRDRTFYQYALLNLATLQADFGCYGESIAAMSEAISTARENKDINCLNFCLSWLYHFDKAHPEEMKGVHSSGMLGTEKEGLIFLKSKAKETGMWSLLSTTLLSEAKLGLQSGENVSIALESIVKASHVNATKNVTNAIGPQLMLQASTFGRLGITQLACSYVKIFLRCYASGSPVEETIRAVCRNSFLLVHKGHYKEAMKIMSDIYSECRCTLRYHQYWVFFSQLLHIQHALYRDEQKTFESISAQLESLPPDDTELVFTLFILRLEHLIRWGEYATALQLIDNIYTKHQNATYDGYIQVKLLIMKARIFNDCGKPQKGFSIIMRAGSIAHRARIMPLLWEATSILAHILNILKEFDASAQILEAIIPQALECELSENIARGYSYLADAHIGLAGGAEKGSSRRKEELKMACEYLDRAHFEYSSIESVRDQRETLAKKAIVMQISSDLTHANDAASNYLNMTRPVSNET